MKYYIGSTTVLDEIYYEQGISLQGINGGAGTYALSGASLWTDEIYFVANISFKQKQRMRKWYEFNKFPMQHIKAVDNNAPVNRIEYYKDGTKIEKKKFDLDYFKQFEYTSSDFLTHVQEECGLYIFRNISKEFWEPFLKISDKKAKILWRIADDACKPDNIEKVQKIAERIDIFSINLKNAKLLYNLNDKDEISKELRQYKTPLVVITDWENGILFIKNGGQIHIPYFLEDEVIDFTGGDDGISAAVLVGYCEGKNVYEMGYMGNHSRVLNCQQFGLPDSIEEYRHRYFLDE